MKLARVIRQVVSTVKHPFYTGKKTFLVRLLDQQQRDTDATFVAVDRVQAGIGDVVLLMQEGSSARQMWGDGEAPVRSTIVGIVDYVTIDKRFASGKRRKKK